MTRARRSPPTSYSRPSTATSTTELVVWVRHVCAGGHGSQVAGDLGSGSRSTEGRRTWTPASTTGTSRPTTPSFVTAPSSTASRPQPGRCGETADRHAQAASRSRIPAPRSSRCSAAQRAFLAGRGPRDLGVLGVAGLDPLRGARHLVALRGGVVLHVRHAGAFAVVALEAEQGA